MTSNTFLITMNSVCVFPQSPVPNWTAETLNQVDRFLFFLPNEIIQLIPFVSDQICLCVWHSYISSEYMYCTCWPTDPSIFNHCLSVFWPVHMCLQGLMSLERIERLFMSQQKWERGELGSLCHKPSELFEKQQFVLQFFLGFLRMGRASCKYNLLPWQCHLFKSFCSL